MNKVQGRSQSKKPAPSYSSDGFFESLRGLGGGVASGMTDTLGKGVGGGVGKGLNSFFTGDFGGYGGEALDRQERPGMVERKGRPQETYYDRIKRNEILLFNNKDREVEQQIEAIRQELKALIAEILSMDSDVIEIQKTIEAPIERAGKYHVSFLEKVRQLLRLVRARLADSKTWLGMCKSKKKQRGYWNMYKKKGTSFGLSNERTVATQAG